MDPFDFNDCSDEEEFREGIWKRKKQLRFLLEKAQGK